jgi:hypothetical protein
MKNIILIAILSAIVWQVYTKYQDQRTTLISTSTAAAESEFTPPLRTPIFSAPAPRIQPELSSSKLFKCDGRTHCSQMSSCEEATFFLKNCPGVKMDGNHDGVPCEQQWCK